MMGYSLGFYLTGLNKKLYINHRVNRKIHSKLVLEVLEGEKCGIVTTDTINDWLVIIIHHYHFLIRKNQISHA